MMMWSGLPGSQDMIRDDGFVSAGEDQLDRERGGSTAHPGVDSPERVRGTAAQVMLEWLQAGFAQG